MKRLLWIGPLFGSFYATINFNSPAEFQLTLAVATISYLFFVSYEKSLLLCLSTIASLILLWELAFGIQDCMYPPIRKPTLEKYMYVEKICTQYLWQYTGWIKERK